MAECCQHVLGVCLQVRMATVLDHVLDTVQHLLKKKVALERAIDPDTPDIIADGSRIVQVCAMSPVIIHFCDHLHRTLSLSCILLQLCAVPCLHEGQQAKRSHDVALRCCRTTANPIICLLTNRCCVISIFYGLQAA